MDIYRIKHTSSTDVLKANTVVVADSAWSAVEAYEKNTNIPCELGDKFKVTLPQGLSLDSGWKVSEDYINEYDLDEDQYNMHFSVGVYYTQKGGEVVILFSPGKKWVKLNETKVEAIDLVVLWA